MGFAVNLPKVFWEFLNVDVCRKIYEGDTTLKRYTYNAIKYGKPIEQVINTEKMKIAPSVCTMRLFLMFPRDFRTTQAAF